MCDCCWPRTVFSPLHVRLHIQLAETEQDESQCYLFETTTTTFGNFQKGGYNCDETDATKNKIPVFATPRNSEGNAHESLEPA